MGNTFTLLDYCTLNPSDRWVFTFFRTDTKLQVADMVRRGLVIGTHSAHEVEVR